MAFDPGQIRLERFKIEAHYHIAFNFLSLKGALAERWAHGPVFGAYAEAGNQVTLTPESSNEQRLQGIYGIRVSAWDHEQVEDEEETYRLARDWFADVFTVLLPKRTVKLMTSWFALYPLSNLDAARAAERRLKTHYYRPDDLDHLQPEGFENKFAAVSSLCFSEDRLWSVEFGAVGPPHRGTFFVHEDKERDGRWWMGLRLTLNRQNLDDGIDEPPLEALGDLITQGADEYERVARQAFGSIF